MILGFALALLLTLAASPAWAAVSCSLPSADWDSSSTTDATSYDTASLTFTSGRVYVAYVASTVSTGTVTVPTLTSTGMTWARANGGTNDAVATFQRLIAAFVGTGSGTGAVTIDFGGQTELNAAWAILECTDADTTDPVVQAIAENTGNATSDTITLAALGGSDNRPIAGFVSNASSAGGSSDWTQLSEIHVDDGTTDLLLHVSWTDSAADLDVVHTQGSTATYKNVALEIAVATASTADICMGCGMASGGFMD